MYGRSRAGRRRRPSPKPQASARGRFASGLIDIVEKDWRDCRIAHPGRIGCAGRRPQAVTEEIERLRRQRWTGQADRCRGRGLDQPPVSRVLRRLGLNKLNALEPAEPVRRYEREKPGELIHLDIKKLGRIGSVGHRIAGRYPWRGEWRTLASLEFVHVCIDDTRPSPLFKSGPTSAKRVLLPSWKSAGN